MKKYSWKKKILLLSVAIFILFLLFGKIDVSSILIKPVTKELQDITGMQVSIDKVSLNFVPLYFEFKNILFKSGKDDLILNKLKLYIGLSEVFNKEIDIRRISVSSGKFSFNYLTLNEFIENIVNYLKKPVKPPLNLKFNSLEVNNISGLVYDDSFNLNLKNLKVRAILRKEPDIFILSNVKILSSPCPNIDANLKASLKVIDNYIVLRELSIFDIASSLKSSGKISTSLLGDFLISGKIFFKSLIKFFGIEGPGYGELNINGKITVIEGQKWHEKLKLNLGFDGSFLLEELMQILKVSEKLSGFAEIHKGKVEGIISAPVMTGKVKLKKGNILGIKTDKLEAEAFYRNGILEFTDGKVNLYGGFARAKVWLTLPVVTKHYVFLEIKGISSNGVFELIKWNPGIAEGTVDGWLISEGKEFSPSGSFTYFKKAQLPEDLRGKITKIKGDFVSEDGIYKFNSLEIYLSETLALANGYVDTKNNYLKFNFVSDVKNINEFLVFYQKGIYGDMYIKGIFSGDMEDPEININFSSNNLKLSLNEIEKSLQSQPFSFDNLRGNIIYKKNILLINDISTQNISIKGKILFPRAKNLFDLQNPVFDIIFSAQNIHVKNFYVKALNNEINTRLDLTGFIKDKGIITGNAIFYPVFLGENKIIDKAVAYAVIEKNSLFIKDAKFYTGGDLLQVSGHLDFEGKMDLKGNSKIFDITSLAGSYTRKIGMKYIEKINLKNLNFNINGFAKDPVITAETEVIAKAKNGKSIDGVVNLMYEKNYLNLKSSLMKKLFFTIEGVPEKNQLNIKGEFNSVRVDPLASIFINNLPEDLVILIDGAMSGSIVDRKVDAQFNLNRIFTRLYGIGLNNKNPLTLTIKKGNLYFNPVTFIGQSTELTIKGKVVDYFDILMEGYTDLRPLKALFKVDDIKGRASILVYIYESRKNPEIVGGIEINNALITLRKDIPSLSNINAIISFNEDRFIIEKAYGNFAEGTVQLEGTVYLEKLKIKQLALSGKISQVRWIFTSKCWAYMDGQFYVAGQYSHPLLSGNLNIQRGVYTERIDWTRLAVKPNYTKTVITKDSWLNNLKLNLRIQTENFFVDNNLATVNLNSDILLRGTIPEPSLIGWINARDGWIYFKGNKFNILRLLIQFNDPNVIRPYLNISAKTNVSQYNVNFNVNGYIDQFNLILSSNPPLSETELLNLLVLGQNGTSKGSATEAASFITRQMHEIIEERIKGLTGLDIMSVEPGISKTTGSLTPKITVGKRLMDGKLSVTYSTQAETTAEQIIKVEYFVKKGISLVGIKDETGGVSGAIKFRFEFR